MIRRMAPLRLTRLAEHLIDVYGIPSLRLDELDVGVARVDGPPGGSWVARGFPPERSPATVRAEAGLLDRLEQAGFPAERLAAPEPVSECDGHQVLVTRFVAGGRPAPPGRAFAHLGGLLGALHSRSGEGLVRGGGWHHLCLDGGAPREEVAAARSLLEARAASRPDAARSLEVLAPVLAAIDDAEDLPHAIVHPDPVPVNAVAAGDRVVLVDWTGAGGGPRLWSLGFLLWAGGARDLRLVDAAMSRYTRRVTLEPAERDRLAGVIWPRPFLLDVWSLCHGRLSLGEVLANLATAQRLAGVIAERALSAG